MGETRVDLLHLLEDLRDAYPGSLEETILTEIVANALDSGATRVSLAADLAGSTVTVVDDGSGMSRDELRRYHDLAASAKTRGSGIGFAGVGIKLGLLASEDVLTETRRGTRTALPARGPVRRERRRAGPRRGTGPRADRGPAGAQAPPGGGGVPLPRRGAAARGAARRGGEHARQGDQARLGLARAHACGRRPRRRADRSAGARRVPDPQQGGLHPDRSAGHAVSRVSQGDPGGGGVAARRVGRRRDRRRRYAPPQDAAAGARSRDAARGPRGRLPAAGVARGAAAGRAAPPAARWRRKRPRRRCVGARGCRVAGERVSCRGPDPG